MGIKIAQSPVNETKNFIAALFIGTDFPSVILGWVISLPARDVQASESLLNTPILQLEFFAAQTPSNMFVPLDTNQISDKRSAQNCPVNYR